MSAPQITIRTLAHGRAGDKGNTLLISVIARCPEYFDHLVRCVTVEHCRNVFTDREVKEVNRYVLPNLQAINFVLEDALDGGVNRSLHQDRHGKTLSSLLLDSLIDEPDD